MLSVLVHLHSMGVCSPCIGEDLNLLSWNRQLNGFPDAWHSMVTTCSHKTNVWSKLMHHQLRVVSCLILCLLISSKNLPSAFSVSVSFPALCDINNYQHLCLTDFCPNEPCHRYQFLQNLHRRLGDVVHLAQAISVRDLSRGNTCTISQVVKTTILA